MIFIDIAKSPQTGSITDNVCGKKLNYKMNGLSQLSKIRL